MHIQEKIIKNIVTFLLMVFALFAQAQNENSLNIKSNVCRFAELKIEGQTPRWFKHESLRIYISRNLLKSKQSQSGYLIVTAQGKSFFSIKITLKKGDVVFPEIKIPSVHSSETVLVALEMPIVKLIASSEGDLKVVELSAVGK